MTENIVTRMCSVNGCESKHRARGYCSVHYKRASKDGEFVAFLGTCRVEGCELPRDAKGYCSKHYGRVHKYGDVNFTKAWRPQGTVEERFWIRVNKDGPIQPRMDTPCWLWLAWTNKKGYGAIDVDGVAWLVHRYSWCLAHGVEPSLNVLHHCDVPACVNPDHLFEGTLNDNVQDMIAKGRQPKGEEWSFAKLTNEQVREIKIRLRDGERVGELARALNLDRRRITAIKTGTAWRCIEI